MGFLAKSATVIAPRASAPSRGAGHGEDFWYEPAGWVTSLAQATSGGSPDLALSLSHVYSCADILSGDFGTCPCGLYRDLGDDGRAKVKFSDPGIGGLAYRLRWQPNRIQSGKAFWSTLSWQYQLRPAAYAEMVYRPGSDSIIDEIWPRHPDRVQQQVLPNGNVRFKLLGEPNGPRYVTQAEMFVVRNTGMDGLNALSRLDHGARVLSSALALQEFTRKYFQKGATASLVGTWKGANEMEDEAIAAMHKNISRYLSGVENAGGLLLVPEDILISALGVDPEKAQLLGLKDLSGRDIARLFKVPPFKLAIAETQTFASQVQSAQDYVTTGQMPQVREFQDGIYIHMIVARDGYAKFNTSHLLQSDYQSRMQGHEIAIRARIKRPSEVRVEEDMSPDDELDQLSAADHRAGSARDGANNRGGQSAAASRPGLSVRTVLLAHDAASRVLRRERLAVERLAQKYPSDVERWQRELRTFYEEHAKFAAETMRLPHDVARAYAAQHGESIEARGITVMTDHWERLEAEALVELSLEPEAVSRLVHPSGGEAHAA